MKRLAATLGTKVTVYLMLAVSSAIMATAWLGHLAFEDRLTFAQAMLASWLLVLPEYALNIAALRLGYHKLTGGQMAAFRLSAGVVCVALVSRFILGEAFTPTRIAGFALMGVAVVLISSKSERDDERDAFDPAAIRDGDDEAESEQASEGIA